MSNPRWALAALSLLLGSACRPEKLNATQGGLQVLTEALLFPDTYLGYPTARPIRLTNSSPGRRTAAVTVDGPFEVEGSVAVEGGSALQLQIRFHPTSAGPATGTVHLEADGQTADVLLSGLALTPPTCPPPAACRSSAFDPAAGACVDSGLPDGADCSQSDLCLSGATCQAGACVGTAKDCDDHNVCTADSCDSLRGCLHTETGSACPQPTEACKVATCDPSSGCGVADAADGTVCGSVDCATAHICLLASCQAVAVPEGTECFPPTPCQGAGACHQQACVRPDPTPLVPAWTYGVDAGVQLYFPGTQDGAGNLYWVECSGSDCSLVSATPGGFIRFRSPLTSQGYSYGYGYPSGGLVLVAGDRVLVGSGLGDVEAHLTHDGSLAWATTLAVAVPQQPDHGTTHPRDTSDPLGSWSSGPLVLGQGVVRVAGRYTYSDGRPDPYQTELVDLDLLDGHAVRDTHLVGYVTDPVVDPSGTLVLSAWLRSDVPDAGETLVQSLLGISPSGAVAWNLEGVTGSPVAAEGSWLYLNDPSSGIEGLVDGGPGPGDGGLLVLGTSSYYWYSYGQQPLTPVIDDFAGFALGTLPAPTCADPCDTPYIGPQPSVSGFDPHSGQVLWTTALAQAPDWTGFAPPILTARHTLLVATGPMPMWEGDKANAVPVNPGGGAMLHELDASGDLLFSCQLPASDPYTYLGGTALHAGRWVVARNISGSSPTVEAYDIAGADPAPTGWISAGGNLQRTGKGL